MRYLTTVPEKYIPENAKITDIWLSEEGKFITFELPSPKSGIRDYMVEYVVEFDDLKKHLSLQELFDLNIIVQSDNIAVNLKSNKKLFELLKKFYKEHTNIRTTQKMVSSLCYAITRKQ